MYIPYDLYDPLLATDPVRLARQRKLTRVTAPASEPVTLAEAKLYLRLDSSSEDTLINDFITATRMAAENWLKASLITQAWKIVLDDGIASCTELPMGPVTAITSMVAFDQAGTPTTIGSANYWLNAPGDTLMMNAAFSAFRIEVTYTTGYGAASAVPKPIKQGMLAHIAALYDSRGDAGMPTLPVQVIALYAPYRGVRL